MEVEKRNSKGGFFQLFDWNGKSRKKLFPDKQESPEGSNHEQGNINNTTNRRLHMVKVDESKTTANLSIGGSYDYHSSPSITTDVRNGSKAPGIVARLMGLDSLPTKNLNDSNSSPCVHSSNPNFQSDHQILYYSNASNNLNGYIRNYVEARPQKLQGRPIARFQNEMLPMVKSVPVTHHKLLSATKNPSFIQSKNITYIMETAARTIEQNPRGTIKVKPPLTLKIRDPKEKLQSAEGTSKRSNTSSNLAKRSSGILKNKDKPTSLAVHAMANSQKKEGLNSSNNTGSTNQKEHVTQKSGLNKTFANRNSNVLKQNNQKQNSKPLRDRLNTTSGSNQKLRKCQSSISSSGSYKSFSSETCSKKLRSVASKREEVVSLPKSNNVHQKEQSVAEYIHCEKSNADNALIDKDKGSINCSIAIDGCMHWKGKKGDDVVSFTFTSPLKKQIPETNSPVSDQVREKTTNICVDDSGKSEVYSLSFLWEERLKEQTERTHSSHLNLVKAGTTTGTRSSLRNSVVTLDALSSCLVENEEKFQLVQKDKSESFNDYVCSSADGLRLNRNQKLQLQGFEGMEEYSKCNSNNSKITKEVEYHGRECYITNSRGRDQCLLAEAEEAVNSISTQESLSIEADTELSDSASSTSIWQVGDSPVAVAFTSTEPKRSTNWELDYISDILSNSGLMLKDVVWSPTYMNIIHDLFDELENKKGRAESNREEKYSKVGRKVLFDCVIESLELRCGGFKGRPIRCSLAEELHKEIFVRRSIGDLKVDELVDRDMSSGYGRWLDFEMEEFEAGVEIERGVLNSLVNELVVDILSF